MSRKFTFRTSFVSQCRELFFDHTPESRGRLCMVISSIVINISSNLAGGAFYSAFLLAYGINLTNIGIIIFIPSIASLFLMVSPKVLSKFKRRRWILLASRIVYYSIYILGITFLPMVVKSDTGKIVGFAVLMFIANVINFIFVPGYSVWHYNFLPERVRSGYFTQSQFLSALVGGLMIVAVSVGADYFVGKPAEHTALIAVRIIAFVFGIIDCIVLALPKEFPYVKSEKKLHLADVIRVPLKNKMFMGTIFIYLFYGACSNLSVSVQSAYLLSSTQVGYTMIYGINFAYALFFILFSGFWQKRIRRMGWVRVYGISSLMLTVTYLLYMFINYENSIWLFPLMRMMQHFVGVGQNVAASNLHLLYMPQEDRDNYVSFYQLVSQLLAFVVMMLGTGFVGLVGDSTLTLLGHEFTSVPMLMFFHMVLCILGFVFARRFHRKELKYEAEQE